jgi:uncharacterized protein YodC (DUF2158 family)
MAFEAGNVVVLKSGGQPMTVVAASEDEVECVWIGEEGEFFRHAIPAIALEDAASQDDEEEEEDEEEDEVAEEADKAKPGRAA